MNEKELELSREKYNFLLKEKEKLTNKKNRLLELENNPSVVEYLKLKEEIKKDENILNDDNIIMTAFSGVVPNTKNSNNILVNVGNLNSYIIYIDLETDEMYSIKLSKKEEFEKNNKIIYLNDNNNNQNLFIVNSNLKKLKKMRIDFFRRLLEKSQDEVIDEIIGEKNQIVKQKNKSRCN